MSSDEDPQNTKRMCKAKLRSIKEAETEIKKKEEPHTFTEGRDGFSRGERKGKKRTRCGARSCIGGGLPEPAARKGGATRGPSYSVHLEGEKTESEERKGAVADRGL